jgi:hypothetical protein
MTKPKKDDKFEPKVIGPGSFPGGQYPHLKPKKQEKCPSCYGMGFIEGTIDLRCLDCRGTGKKPLNDDKSKMLNIISEIRGEKVSEKDLHLKLDPLPESPILKPSKQEKGEGEIGNELDKDADNHPSSPETPRAHDPTDNYDMDEKGHLRRKPAPKEPDKTPLDNPDLHDPNIHITYKEPDKMTEWKDHAETCEGLGCKDFKDALAKIDALTQKVKHYEELWNARHFCMGCGLTGSLEQKVKELEARPTIYTKAHYYADKIRYEARIAELEQKLKEKENEIINIKKESKAMLVYLTSIHKKEIEQKDKDLEISYKVRTDNCKILSTRVETLEAEKKEPSKN